MKTAMLVRELVSRLDGDEDPLARRLLAVASAGLERVVADVLLALDRDPTLKRAFVLERWSQAARAVLNEIGPNEGDLRR
jgi:hypothetical protein